MGIRPTSFPIDVALVHYPVHNRIGETVGSAVTNLDLHDIARACRTYGVNRFYVVTPYQDQQKLVREILAHWLTGHGSRVNVDRGEALSLVQLCDDLEGLYSKVSTERGSRPTVLATSAREMTGIRSYKKTRDSLVSGSPLLLLFGTAWGLADEVMDEVDGILPPITGPVEDYNHLSVRSAVSIILDRLLGQRE